jgi:hypothetical protein
MPNEDQDTPIYRIFPLRRLREALQNYAMALVSPSRWEDPLENLISWCGITYIDEPWRPQEFPAETRKPVYAQCWSLARESDAMWRMYSRVRKDKDTLTNLAVEEEGVQVRTTVGKLLRTLRDLHLPDPTDSCFLGRVIYVSEEQLKQFFADEIGRAGRDAFRGGIGHAKSLLFKRTAFEHEREVRLIYVEHGTDAGTEGLLSMPVDPNALFDEVVLDPRLSGNDVLARKAELRNLGFERPVTESMLYKKTLLEIGVVYRKLLYGGSDG